jgi:hypothetical protein
MSDNGKTDRNKMSIDERLKFLVESTESLHDQMAQFVEEGRQQRESDKARFLRQEAAERKHRRAIMVAMQSYLDALDEGEGKTE